MPEGPIKVTDPDSRVVKGLRGFLQGYNAQAVTTEHQVVLAAEIETVGADVGHLEPMLDATQRELAAAGINDTREVVPADAGDWHGEEMQQIADRGIEVLIPPDTSRTGANRRVNAILHRMAVTQRRCHPRAQTLYANARARGKTNKEARPSSNATSTT